jgi:hypothetical protein
LKILKYFSVLFVFVGFNCFAQKYNVGGTCRSEGTVWNGTSCVPRVTTTRAKTCATSGRRSGSTGCCTEILPGQVDWHSSYCKSQKLCERNLSFWYDNQCNDKPENSSVSKKCDPSATEQDTGLSVDATAPCYCPPVNGKPGGYVKYGEACEKKSEETADNNCSKKVENYGWDGNDCLCGGKDADSFEVVAGKCQKKNSQAAKSCDKEGEILQSNGTCGCNTKLGYEISSEDWRTCIKSASATAPTECTALTQFEDKVKSCQTKGLDAVKGCDPKNTDSNKNYGDAQSAVQAMSQVSMIKGQQAGSSESCFNAGVIGTAAYQALDLLKSGCRDEISKCEEECGVGGFLGIGGTSADDIVAKCESEIKQKNPNITPTQLEPLLSDIKKKATTAKSELDTGIKSCTVDAKSNMARTNDLMRGVNTSAQQAAKCQCQLTAGQTSCDQIQGPEYCARNPSDTLKCPPVVTLRCVGADKDNKDCVCMRDPGNSMCKTNSNTTGSQLAGATNLNPIGAGNPNFKPGSGLGPNGGLDGLNDLASSSTSMDKTTGTDPQFNVAGGGSGGAGSNGGGASGGPAEGSAAGADATEAKSGIGGLFNNLKTGLLSAMGIGSKNNSAGRNYGDKGKAGTAMDPDKWKPNLRGVAGGTGMGRKNADIFKMINNQYNDQYHTLMTISAPAAEVPPK